MSIGIFEVPVPTNEVIKMYGADSYEKKSLKAELKKLSNKTIEIPMIIGGKKIRTGQFGECRVPHNHDVLLAKYHMASKKEVERAIKAASQAKAEWSSWSWEERAAIFLKAANLLAGPYRDVLNAATMLAQSKTAFQAEIDAACELIDFFKFNVAYYRQLLNEQPSSDVGMWNRVEYRALDGFVFAVTPFNFTSIAANLPTAPALLGNTVIWKPASTAVYSAHFIMQLLIEAGLPDGVINMVLGSGKEIGKHVLLHPDLAGIHFTGSTATFQHMWKTVGNNIANYKSYPRIVGETGGKDFMVVHPSADFEALATALVRGAFEYQGQKCSALSRAYIPKSIWAKLEKRLINDVSEIKMGDVSDFTNLIGAVIDKRSFDKIKGYIDRAKSAKNAKVIVGGQCDDSKGYFIRPTVILSKSARYESMVEEIFGPVLTVYVYDDNKFEQTLELCDSTSPYALTGAIFSQDRTAVKLAINKLRHAAGNFYINDKPTGAVVGQQPFGGGRASGTNDKAGSVLNLIRWASPRTIKETFVPQKGIAYPHMDEE